MPTKKSTAKKGKFSALLNKLNPNSTKKKLLLFVIVFGLIAGGFYAYRSLAATKTHTFWLSEGLEAQPPFQMKSFGDIRTVIEPSGQKGNKKVLQLTGSNKKWAGAGAYESDGNHSPGGDRSLYFRPGKYKVCAVVKSKTTSARFILAMVSPNAKGGDPFQNGGGLQSSTNEYANICQHITATTYSWPEIIVGRGSIMVSILSITPL